MSNFILEVMHTSIPLDNIMNPEVQEDNTRPHSGLLLAREVVGITQPSALDDYLEVTAKRAAIERLNSQNARRDSETEFVNHDANQWFFDGMNRTYHDDIQRTKFLVFVNKYYNEMKYSK